MTNRGRVAVYLVGVLLGVVVVSYFPRGERKQEHPWHQQTAPEGTYPLTVADDYGRRVTVERQPRFVVSLAPSTTEMLFAMGLGDHVMGVTRWCQYPAEAVRVGKQPERNVGNLDQPDREKVLALRPDLVLGSTLTPAEVYEGLGQQVAGCALAHDTLAGVEEDIAFVGRVMGQPERAEALRARMRERVAAVQAAVAGFSNKPRVLLLYGLEAGNQPGWSPGTGTWADDLLNLAGAENVAASLGRNWGPISLEAVVASNPEVILLKDGQTAGEREALRSQVRSLAEDRGWSHVAAVAKGRVVFLNPEHLSIPGPRLVWALEDIAEAVWGVQVPEATEPLFATAPLHQMPEARASEGAPASEVAEPQSAQVP